MKELFLISGLPRAGSTLLATILNQNEEFHATIAGPLARMVRAVVSDTQSDGSKNEQIIRTIVDTYCDEDKVYFDQNRGWNLLLPVMKQLYPNTKVVVCVRNMADICNSFEVLVRKNMLQANYMFSPEENVNVYTRTEALMMSSKTVGFAYESLKQAYFSHEKNMLHIIEYNDLCRNPEKTIKKLYQFLGKDYYNHDYENVSASYKEFDAEIRLNGLHTTKKVVKVYDNPSVLPPDLKAKFKNMEFWR